MISVNLKLFIFSITYISESLLIFLVVVSMFNHERRFWPPPSKNSFEFYIVWTLTIISVAGIISLAVLDWNNILLDNIYIRSLGIALIVFGNILALWGVKTLSVKASTGLKHKIVTEGPYKYTRNPQYLGDIIVLVGAALLVSSVYVIITCLLGILIFYLLPFPEEPWLEKMYGEEYLRYKRRTPRFIGLKSLKKDLSD